MPYGSDSSTSHNYSKFFEGLDLDILCSQLSYQETTTSLINDSSNGASKHNYIT